MGVRELKAQLSAYLDRVRAGETLVVTARGKPVARRGPMDAPSQPPHVEALWRASKVRWSGQPARIPAGEQVTPGESMTDRIVAERERD